MNKSCIFLFLLAIGVLANACAFETRSPAFACPNGDECDGDRTCVDGWCVATTASTDAMAGGIDAPPADAFVCPDECGRCLDGVCIFECEGVSSCSDTVVCPAGVPCSVDCNGIDSCGGGVDCSLSSSCSVECDGTGACAQRVDCGAGPCSLTCDGPGSCAGGLECSSSCECESSCPGGTCNDHSCPGNSPCTKADGCSSSAGACRTCT